MTDSQLAIGVDIGGTGIKGALVNLTTGELVSERFKIPTPEDGEPEAIAHTVLEIVNQLPEEAEGKPLGICFPAIVKNGKTHSAANVSKRWINFEAEKLFTQTLGRRIRFINDADAAGFAEVKYGAARDTQGAIIVTTLGTGIGSAFIYNGVLIPNFELGHLPYQGESYEKFAANSVREREELEYPVWAERLQLFYSELEFLFSPDLFLVGGGVSKSHEKFLPLLKLKAPIIPAALRNNAGIMGAAALAA
ncbi:polyphosphate--glucose phosphotransferase [Lysinibacter sp. HNR]|uniref:polyphosphate--glucose phosphotransferase n=1 Tax=Lysinibacter sp. HNR TaxID=3031408 RepID=UPI002434DFBE|nr:ROK family protein [Lysinibacter sp. HNR]WGD38564.1 ROK family protein [Lysinibacter sp. HNR]